MAKRLTATEKWTDVWFRKLSVEAKVLFEFLRDNCDIAGFWEVDLETASFFTGIPQDVKGGFDSIQPPRGIEGAFKELRRAYIGSDRHVWLKNFLYHQKNLPLNPENPCHKGILNIIHSRNTFGSQVLEEIEKQNKERGFKGASMGLQSPIGKGKGKGIGIGKGNRGVQGGTIKTSTALPEDGFDSFWKQYPKKVGKGAAKKAWAKLKPGEKLVQQILGAVAEQKESLQWNKEDGQYIPHPATWLNQERWGDELESLYHDPTEEDIEAFNARYRAKTRKGEDIVGDD